MKRLFTSKNIFFYLLSLYGIFFVLLSYISWSRSDFFILNIETFTDYQRSTVSYLFLGLIILYAFIAYRIRNDFFSLQKTIFISLPFVLLLVCTPPLLSTDTAIYAVKTKNFVQLHESPYKFSPIDSSWREEIGSMPWAETGSLYGPLFHVFMIPFGAITSLPASVTIFVYKIALALFFFFSIFLMKTLLHSTKAPSYFLVLYALNPALLINGVMEGHNDLLILFLLLALFYFLYEKYHIKSMVFYAISVGIKYITILLLPIFFIYHHKFKWKELFTVFSILSLMALISAFIFTIPISDITNKLQMRETLPCLYHCSPLVAVTNFFAGTHAQTIRFISFVFAYLLIVYYFLIQKHEPIKFTFWSLFALLFIYSSWITPWYLLILFPFALLYAHHKLYAYMFWILTFYSLLSYF